MANFETGTRIKIINAQHRYYGKTGTILRPGKAGGYWVKIPDISAEIYVPFGYTADTTKPRFSKAELLRYIEKRRTELENEFAFDPDNGTAQCDGKSDDFKIAYGEYDGLYRLMDVML